ncbi:hypothetical protein OTU49_006412 [Cherax quadricarinatus]|uniref:Fascin domain-containing protein n=1 Tax=Cherax quadricarinatus TaxID=27406 RepID=A0AAW0X259_CHEQU
MQSRISEAKYTTRRRLCRLAGSTRSSERRVQYRELYIRKFRLQGDYALYLSPAPAGGVLDVAAQRSNSPNEECFRVHTFDVLTPFPEGGQVAVLETYNGGRFLHGTSSGNLSLTSEGNDVTSLSQIDGRFFLLHSPLGASHYRIKHITTGLYLSAGQERVSLVTFDSRGFAGNARFEVFSCSRS